MAEMSAQVLDPVVRAVAAADRALRLYPPASPIPRQAVDNAMVKLEAALGERDVIAVEIGRDGFTVEGEPIAHGVLGIGELADELRAHDVAEVAFQNGVTSDDVLGLLRALETEPDDIRDEGGLPALLAFNGVRHINVANVKLTAVEGALPDSGADVDGFLRTLASDEKRLATWMSAASQGDPEAFGEGLMELERVMHDDEKAALLKNLADAFAEQAVEGKDAMIGLGLSDGPERELVSGVLHNLPSDEIAQSLLTGGFGQNMLSLSTALSELPLDDAIRDVHARVQANLRKSGHSAREAEFLEHMLDVRASGRPEAAVTETDKRYTVVARASRLGDELLVRARGAVEASSGALDSAGVLTMLSLLDQQQDQDLYCQALTNLAAMVPRLVEQGDLSLAARVLAEIQQREISPTAGPWPELSERVREAMARAAGPQTMGALLDGVAADPSLVPAAREIIAHGGQQAASALVAEALAHRGGAGLDLAEELLGVRLLDILIAEAPSTPWHRLGPIAARLAREGSPRSISVVEVMLSRPDDSSRREVATALAVVGGPEPVRLLGKALRDQSTEVAIVAARAVGRSGVPGSAEVLCGRLDEIDLAGADFLLAREIIAALARVPDDTADATLRELATRRKLFKRGHFAECQDLARQALQVREQRRAAAAAAVGSTPPDSEVGA